MRRFIVAMSLGATLLMIALGSVAFAAGTNGSGTDMPAFYDCELFTVNFKQVSLDVSHSQINTIYEFPQCPWSPTNPTGFKAVLDQIVGGEVESAPKNGFNPLWQLVEVNFDNGCPSEGQVDSGFCSDNAVAATGATCTTPAGGITLTCTGEVFRCAVVGKK